MTTLAPYARIAIYNGLASHVEMYGFILDWLNRNGILDQVDIFTTTTTNTFGWLLWYEKQFNFQFPYFTPAEFINRAHHYQMIVLITEWDSSFKESWLDLYNLRSRVIKINHRRNPLLKNRSSEYYDKQQYKLKVLHQQNPLLVLPDQDTRPSITKYLDIRPYALAQDTNRYVAVPTWPINQDSKPIGMKSHGVSSIESEQSIMIDIFMGDGKDRTDDKSLRLLSEQDNVTLHLAAANFSSHPWLANTRHKIYIGLPAEQLIDLISRCHYVFSGTVKNCLFEKQALSGYFPLSLSCGTPLIIRHSAKRSCGFNSPLSYRKSIAELLPLAHPSETILATVRSECLRLRDGIDHGLRGQFANLFGPVRPIHPHYNGFDWELTPNPIIDDSIPPVLHLTGDHERIDLFRRFHPTWFIEQHENLTLEQVTEILTQRGGVWVASELYPNLPLDPLLDQGSGVIVYRAGIPQMIAQRPNCMIDDLTIIDESLLDFDPKSKVEPYFYVRVDQPITSDQLIDQPPFSWLAVLIMLLLAILAILLIN